MLTCYCIRTLPSEIDVEEQTCRTYVGATNDFRRRIRQHNREIVGGARATHGHRWYPFILVQGFATRHELLRFEWWWKHAAQFRQSEIHVAKQPSFRRVDALEYLLRLDEWRHLRVYCDEKVAAWCHIDPLYAMEDCCV